ncbi:MAG: peptidylprolyl isomerase [Syntrophobacteraceae bacterium]
MLRRIIKLLTCAIICCCFTGGPVFSQESAQAGDAQKVLISIGQRSITQKELELRKQLQNRENRKGISPGDQARMVDLIIERTLFAEEARALGMDKDEATQIAVRDVVDNLLATIYFNRRILPGVQVSEAEIKAYYDAHENLFRTSETVRARHILFRVRPQASADEVQSVAAQAQEVKRRLDAGEDFAELAKAYSEDTGTKASGGDLGYFDAKGKTAALSDAAFRMKVNEISVPIRSSVGYHILQVTDRKPPSVKQLDEVRGEIHSQLIREKRADAAKTARKQLEEKYRTHIDAELLKEMDAKEMDAHEK